MKTTLAITPGEPAGIGPDIVLQYLHHEKPPCHLVVIADQTLLENRAKQLGLKIPRDLTILPITLKAPCIAGELSQSNAPYVLETLDRAIAGCLNHEFTGLVTGPIHKGIINTCSPGFSGHTEYLAKKTHSLQPIMVLIHDSLRVALMTTHIPLQAVSAAITQEKIITLLSTLQEKARTQLHIQNPRFTVCGLNPHAGEDGHLGREEIEIITPALNELRQQGFSIQGPVSADTAFHPSHFDQQDFMVAMYHDQGLIPIKTLGFYEAINVTLGLPFLRASVDHGTALSLAGTNQSNYQSLKKAIEWMYSLC